MAKNQRAQSPRELSEESCSETKVCNGSAGVSSDEDSADQHRRDLAWHGGLQENEVASSWLQQFTVEEVLEPEDLDF